MKFGGLVSNSLIDFPGRPAMIAFTQGCNWLCPFCHNPRLISKRSLSTIEGESIIKLVAKRPEGARNLVITGGEPTIQPELLDFLDSCRNTEIRVKLDTNGSQSEILQTVIEENLVDYVAMDVKGPIDRYEELVGCECDCDAIRRSIQLLKRVAIDYEFRTTVVPALHREADFRKLGELLKGGKRLVLQAFRPHRVLEPELRDSAPPTDLDLAHYGKILNAYLRTEIRK
ncbi:MAG: anaerobic ribonucleoside-triphosphate reductase activating protein [Verrucomicrobiota bacterium]